MNNILFCILDKISVMNYAVYYFECNNITCKVKTKSLRLLDKIRLYSVLFHLISSQRPLTLFPMTL